MPNREQGDWWDRSWTIVSGCNWPEGERPEECRYCYAEPMCFRFDAIHPAYGGFPEIMTHPDRLEWMSLRGKAKTWLCSIAGDLFHEEVPDGFISDVVAHARDTQRKRKDKHRIAILTKRYDRAATFCESAETWPANTILMFSAGTQANVDRACAAAAKLPEGVRWGLHLEPLLGAVDLSGVIGHAFDGMDTQREYCYHASGLAWIVVGGETNVRNRRAARPMHPDWVRPIRDQCQAAGVPFWFKSWGEWAPNRATTICASPRHDWPDGKYASFCFGKARAGRMLDGRTWDEMPEGWEASEERRMRGE